MSNIGGDVTKLGPGEIGWICVQNGPNHTQNVTKGSKSGEIRQTMSYSCANLNFFRYIDDTNQWWIPSAFSIIIDYYDIVNRFIGEAQADRRQI